MTATPPVGMPTVDEPKFVEPSDAYRKKRTGLTGNVEPAEVGKPRKGADPGHQERLRHPPCSDGVTIALRKGRLKEITVAFWVHRTWKKDNKQRAQRDPQAPGGHPNP